MKGDRSLKVFLSHAHADRDSVRALYSRLTKDGVDAWLDKEKLLAGQDWELEIRKAVREADVVVVCLSKQFNQAGFRQKEVRLALDTALEQPEGEIFIIPVRLEECEPLESLRRWHWVDLYEESGYHLLLRALQNRADQIGAAMRQKESIWTRLTQPKIAPPIDRWNSTINYIKRANTLESISLLSETIGEASLLDSDPELRRFWIAINDVSQHISAALSSETLYNRKEQLQLALKLTKQILTSIEDYPIYHVARQAESSLNSWLKTIEKVLEETNRREQIPNVYIAGTPLAGKSKVFKGRKDLFRLLERELATEAEQRPALLLFGARRTGKTSVLRQLSNILGPQVIPAMVDLQGIALASSTSSVFLGIADEIRRSALSTRRIDLPAIDRNSMLSDPYVVFTEWLKKVEDSLDERWLLLCIDEYEYLEKLLNDNRVDIRAFQLLRNLIQNYSRLITLFSGSHTFEELDPIWSNYLINVRTLKIGSLEKVEARELIINPIKSFPLQYTDNAVERIISVTACQPYLLQATCRDLVNILNDENRKQADEKVVERAFTSVLTSGSSYFYDLWRGETSDGQREIMTFIAKRNAQYVNQSDLRKYGTISDIHKLENHDVIEKTEDGYHFKVELVRRWIESQI